MFGDILKQLRNSKGLKQKELGELIAKSKSTIAMYEAGIRMPDSKTLKALSTYFEVSIDFLLENDLKINNLNIINELKKENLELKQKIGLIKNILR